jgi:hypothetical protein
MANLHILHVIIPNNLITQFVDYVINLKETTKNKNKAAVREDDDEIRVRVKIKPDVMESVARADVRVDANVLHAPAIADVLNPAAPRNANLVVTDAGVKYDYTK